MRGALFWLVWASLAFLVTAGAFLLLANFGTAPNASAPIPRSAPPEPGPSGPRLVLNFSEDGLEELERRRNQPLTLYVENGGDRELKSVDLELAVSSGSTASPRVRRYGETVPALAPGEVEAVDLRIDLSSSPPVESAAVRGERPGEDREVIEARAYAAGEPIVVKTAVVAP